MERLASEEGAVCVNLTDGDAQLVKGRHGIEAGCNAQAVVMPVHAVDTESGGLLTTAADAATTADDYGQLMRMMEQAEKDDRTACEVTLADDGYHTGANLEACEQSGQRVAMPEGQREAMKRP